HADQARRGAARLEVADSRLGQRGELLQALGGVARRALGELEQPALLLERERKLRRDRRRGRTHRGVRALFLAVPHHPPGAPAARRDAASARCPRAWRPGAWYRACPASLRRPRALQARAGALIAALMTALMTTVSAMRSCTQRRSWLKMNSTSTSDSRLPRYG